MLKLTPETPRSGRTSAAVSLLDWFDLRKELILVMERPVPAVDLWEYIEENGGTLTEETAKAILKQLIEAAKELEDKNIFHRDIKIENILIETGSDVPRVRLIDFGMSCFFKKRSWYRIFSGTPSYCPPEWYLRQYYRPGPTTVWQLGAVLYETLHARPFFDTILVLNELLEISEELSENCQDFLKMCLDLDPKRRPILEDLLLHRWFR
ncbi:serine/threonine-protein kinase pim-3-like isoform X2 [Archocentrus centrarchus]|nr:serine/threonine-protein kinase pim-3-like isoform X2 [Archocentrus centrarchus]XP_030578802.1 serine/threonine-protein kinase pim-3-like isoform X2 [Archocentrus centrarchus]